MKAVPVRRVDLEYPARTDGNGVTWYRPAQTGEPWGWTSDPAQAHLSYFNPNARVLQSATRNRKRETNE